MSFGPQCFHERRPSLVPNEVVYRQCQNVDELSVVYCSADPVVVGAGDGVGDSRS